MVIVPVIDLKGGVVVRGVGGKREEYRPIVSQIADDARPETVAQALAQHFRAETVYVADLDAIAGGPPDSIAYRRIAATGMQFWLDAGTGNARAVQSLSDELEDAEVTAGIIVGLETLANWADLQEIVATFGAGRILFSLDLKAGLPLTTNSEFLTLTPPGIAAAVIAAGITRLIVLDLADVGTSGGTSTLELCRTLSRQHPHLQLIAGGGVRGPADLATLSSAGVHAALVASALHDGRITKANFQTPGEPV